MHWQVMKTDTMCAKSSPLPPSGSLGVELLHPLLRLSGGGGEGQGGWEY
jgi:hypothetical protein